MKVLLTIERRREPRVFLYENDEDLFDYARRYGSTTVILDSVDDAREALTCESYTSYTFQTYAEAANFARSYRGPRSAAVRAIIEDVARQAGGDPDQLL